MTVTFATNSASETIEAGACMARVVRPGDVVLLSGDLGAGKTQLVKGLASGLGVIEPVTSPTFNILLVHEGSIPLYHFDLYRLDSAEQLEDIDYFGVLEADGVSAVEWGDRFEEACPLDGIVVRMSITAEDGRRFDVEPLGERGAELAAAWLSAMGVA